MSRRNQYNKTEKITRLSVNKEGFLMEFLLNRMGGMSRSSVKSLLSYRQVSVNDKIETHFRFPLKPGDEVTINRGRGNVELNHPMLRVIYEDNDFIVVDKKEGLLSVTVGTGRDITAFSVLKNYVKKSSPANKIYTVHRLDKFTSGVLLFSKNRDLQHMLRNHWHELVTRRTYLAAVEGKVEKEHGEISSWLIEDPIKLKAISSRHDNGGKHAITRYHVLQTTNSHSLLEVELVTGRKNQIRVHMEDIGHPILGDRKYGATETFNRLALHASVLEFTHPQTGKLLRFESPLPREIARLFNTNRDRRK